MILHALNRSARQWTCAVVAVVAVALAGCRGDDTSPPPLPEPVTVTPSGSAPGFTPVVGHWTTVVEDGQLVVTGDARAWDGRPRADLAVAARTLFPSPEETFTANASAEGAFPIAIATHVPRFTEGTLEVDFKLIGGESDQIAGLIFDLRPNGEYLYVRYNTRDDDVALWRFVNGNRENIAHGPNTRRLALDAWHPLQLTVSGSRLSVRAAGDLTLEYDLGRTVDGRVGVWTKRDSITAFRNLRATPAGAGSGDPRQR